MKRPLGLVVLVIIAVVDASLDLLLATLAIAEGEGVVAIIGFVLGGAMLVFAYGAWRASSWAWMLGLVLFGLSLISAFTTFSLDPAAAVSLLIAVLAVIYLFQTRTREYFHQED